MSDQIINPSTGINPVQANGATAPKNRVSRPAPKRDMTDTQVKPGAPTIPATPPQEPATTLVATQPPPATPTGNTPASAAPSAAPGLPPVAPPAGPPPATIVVEDRPIARVREAVASMQRRYFAGFKVKLMWFCAGALLAAALIWLAGSRGDKSGGRAEGPEGSAFPASVTYTVVSRQGPGRYDASVPLAIIAPRRRNPGAGDYQAFLIPDAWRSQFSGVADKQLLELPRDYTGWTKLGPKSSRDFYDALGPDGPGRLTGPGGTTLVATRAVSPISTQGD